MHIVQIKERVREAKAYKILQESDLHYKIFNFFPLLMENESPKLTLKRQPENVSPWSWAQLRYCLVCLFYILSRSSPFLPLWLLGELMSCVSFSSRFFYPCVLAFCSLLYLSLSVFIAQQFSCSQSYILIKMCNSLFY